jgi:hypothetical protein
MWDQINRVQGNKYNSPPAAQYGTEPFFNHRLMLRFLMCGAGGRKTQNCQPVINLISG